MSIPIPPLFTAAEASDPAYRNIRDDVGNRAIRASCEHLWSSYYRDADEHFLTEIRRDFGARFWEMYLTCAFRKQAQALSYSVSCPKPGPDILLESASHRTWVEAVIVTDGDPGKADAPLQREPNGGIPIDQIVLRYTHAIDAKRRKYV